MQRGVDDSIRRHPTSLAPPERHRRFGPWGILAAAVSAAALVAGGALVVTIATSPDPRAAGQVMGGPAPEFELTSLDGRTAVRLSDLRGRVIVVGFGRQGCAPCRTSELALDRAWRQFRGRGVVVMGIRSGAATVAATVPTPRAWPVLADPGGRTAKAYGVEETPETFVISPDGRVVAGLAGPVTYPVLVAQISLLLGSTGATRRHATPASSEPP